jgi:hypothetical protein
VPLWATVSVEGIIMLQSRIVARARAQPGWTRPLRRVALCGLVSLVALAVLSPGVARAQEEESSSVWDSITGLVKGLRFGSPDQDIDYRERSPLVVPSTRALPPPQAPGTGRVANWPVDPDLKRKQEAAERRKRGEGRFDYDTFIAPESPSQLNAPGAGAPTPPPAAPPSNGGDMTAALPPSQLGGGKSLFGNLFGGGDQKTAVFTQERPRRSLTDPPVGYQTPSPDQPYGITPPPPKPAKPQDAAVGDVGL